MVLGSHNSWTFLRPRKLWMYLIRFTARCQDKDIYEQFTDYGVRCFDLRVRYDDDCLVVSHGLVDYDIDEDGVLGTLEWLNARGGVYIRLLHEVRTEKRHTEKRIREFRDFCGFVEKKFTDITFYGGQNLCDGKRDYIFNSVAPSCEEKYSSVMPPYKWDDWFPRIYALLNNRKILAEGTDKDVLMIDFVNIS